MSQASINAVYIHPPLGVRVRTQPGVQAHGMPLALGVFLLNLRSWVLLDLVCRESLLCKGRLYTSIGTLKVS